MSRQWPTVCATGHRPQHLQPHSHDWVRTELARIAVKLRDHHGTTVGISGMALGVDQWWAQAVLDAGLALWAYIPSEEQGARWNVGQLREWQRLLDSAAKVRVFGTGYSVGLLHARNDGMLDDADAVVAVHRQSKTQGGTASAVGKARKRGLTTISVDPDKHQVRIHYAPAALGPGTRAALVT